MIQKKYIDSCLFYLIFISVNLICMATKKLIGSLGFMVMSHSRAGQSAQP